MSWWQQHPDWLASLKAEVSSKFPALSVKLSDGRVIVTGTWLVIPGYAFEVLIELDDDYPDVVPRVWEVGGHLPRTPDRHFYQDTGNACLFSWPERYEYWPPGSSFSDFLTGPVAAFFVSQVYFDLHGTWPFGTRPHGDRGPFEYFAEQLGTSDPRVIEALLRTAMKLDFRLRKKCPCGSGKRVAGCHAPRLRRFNRIGLTANDLSRAISIASHLQRQWEVPPSVPDLLAILRRPPSSK